MADYVLAYQVVLLSYSLVLGLSRELETTGIRLAVQCGELSYPARIPFVPVITETLIRSKCLESARVWLGTNVGALWHLAAIAT